MKRPVRLLYAAAMLPLSLGLPPHAGLARHTEARLAGAQLSVAASGQLTPVMVVIDDSGSMGQSLGRQTKIAAAKAAVRNLIAQVPPGSRIGLMTYGNHSTSSDADRATSCKDISVQVPVGPLDSAAIDSAASDLTPGGWTPIAGALRKAAAGLPESGRAAIVLVSDGQETCGGNPCLLARQLEARNIDVRIDTIGLGVDDAGRGQLTCVAQNTGGTYTGLSDAGSLAQTLPRLVSQAVRNYQASGIPVNGTPQPSGAPSLHPGQYLDALREGQTKYYAVDVPKNYTLYLSAVTGPYHFSGFAHADNPQLEVSDTRGDTCQTGSADEQEGKGSEGDLAITELSWAGAVPGSSDNTKADDGCASAGQYIVKYSRATAGGTLPVELLVGLEPPATSAGPAPADGPATGSGWPSGTAQRVTGGDSFGAAASLPGTGIYQDTLGYGDNVIYRVRLRWGQAVSCKIRFGGVSGGQSDVWNDDSSLYSPWRAQIDSGSTIQFDHGDAAALGTFSSALVRYRNRESADDQVAASRIAGWYYIRVKVGTSNIQPEGTGAIPVTLDVAVTGTPGGAPVYAGQSGAGVFGGTPGNATAAPRRGTASRGSGFSAVPVAAGAALAVLAGAVALTVVRRRGRRQAGGWY